MWFEPESDDNRCAGFYLVLIHRGEFRPPSFLFQPGKIILLYGGMKGVFYIGEVLGCPESRSVFRFISVNRVRPVFRSRSDNFPVQGMINLHFPHAWHSDP